MEIFIKCLEAVSGMCTNHIQFEELDLVEQCREFFVVKFNLDFSYDLFIE